MMINLTLCVGLIIKLKGDLLLKIHFALIYINP